ncbi:MAG: hypothetical protein IIA54_02235 [Chloroflexi bacterium]|nr:hypothetical protein [Chloroflexota bacterium]
MSQAPAPSRWAPPSDDGLTWLRPSAFFPAAPGPLEHTLEVHARAFGLTRALQSLNFPLFEFRTQLVDGALYYASVPSALAERDLEGQWRRLRDASLRFMRSVPRGWERAIGPEVDGYNRWIEEMADPALTAEQMAEQLLQLRRVRGNQWYTALRGVFGPGALFEHRLQRGEAPEEDAPGIRAVVQAAREAVAVRGGELMTAALERVGASMVDAGSLDGPADLHWLEWGEVRDAFEQRTDCRGVVAERKRASATPTDHGALEPSIGPELPADSPRMFLVRETMALIGDV